MTENRIRVSQQQVATAYSYPLTPTLISATTEGAAETLAEVREGSNGLLKRLAVVNQTGSAVALTVNFIPSGGTIGAGNREIAGYSVGANAHVDLTDIVGGFYPEGTTIKAFAGSADALLVTGYIEGQL